VEVIMASDAVVRARIRADVKDEASQVLAEMGLTVSDAIRLMLIRVAAEKALPFPVKVPNAETVAAMEAALAEDVERFDSVEELIRDLNAAD
jgi:DNA-damage-inducible protein J